MERLLCIKIASRGDLLLAAPAFRLLRASRPKSELTLLVGASCEDVARRLPYFDHIRILDDRALLAGTLGGKIKGAWSLFQHLKAETYAGVLIFHRDWRYAFLSFLAGIPERTGFGSVHGTRFLTHSYVADVGEHHVHQYIGMVSMMGPTTQFQQYDGIGLKGVWQFLEGEKDRALALAENSGFKVNLGPWIALGFGGGRNVKTRTELKTWPLESYRQLATLLRARGHPIVWVGDKEDERALGDVATGVNLAGKLSVAETAVVLSSCVKVVTNDTLTLHLAEAVGTPSLGLFGPTDPAHYKPLGERSMYLWLGTQLACSPCHQDGYFPPCNFEHRCMKELSVKSVFEAITAENR